MATPVESDNCTSLAKKHFRGCHTIQLFTFGNFLTCGSIAACKDGRPPETANCKCAVQ